jgi:hypothetical protein
MKILIAIIWMEWKGRHHAFSKFIISNSKFLVKNLDDIIDKTIRMYKGNAYLQHYERYGVSKEDIWDSIVCGEHTLHNYMELNSDVQNVAIKDLLCMK